MKRDPEMLQWQKRTALAFVEREKASTSREINPRVLAGRAATYVGVKTDDVLRWMNEGAAK